MPALSRGRPAPVFAHIVARCLVPAFDGPVHPFDLAVGPWTLHLGQVMFDDRLLLNAQYRRMNVLGAGWQILKRCVRLPLGDGLLVDPVPLGELNGGT